MSKIVLATLNARYAHTAIGLRYLYANLHELQPLAQIQEFTVKDQPATIAESILAQQPEIVGFGVYIWNALETQRVIHLLKKVAPQLKIVLGGPEVSYLPQRVDFERVDYIVPGEGEWAFYALCKALLERRPPAERFYQVPIGDLASLAYPYPYYSEHDLQHRIAYVEASRGCPFTCEFCLSSRDEKVRKFELEAFLAQLEDLWQRGGRNFKFIDRTFNLNPKVTNQILDFFLAKPRPYFVHFEMIPDHFPQHLKDKLRLFEPTTLQLEIGIQSLNPEVSGRIKRKLKAETVKENLQFLAQQTHAHMHLDLIVGLPGESIESFGHNLNSLVNWVDSEVQVGILKKLSGTDLFRHDQEFEMVYADYPPYDILQNRDISFVQMQEMKRFARFWDLTYNSGNFQASVRLLWPAGDVFEQFRAFSAWLYAQTQATAHISLFRLAELLFNYLIQELKYDAQSVGQTMLADLTRTQSLHIPPFLKPFKQSTLQQTSQSQLKGIKRQLKHAALSS